MHVLITGGAGFIGSHLGEALLARGERVCVLDNFDAAYDPALKRENLRASKDYDSFELVVGDIRDAERVETLFQRQRFDAVVHLAALAGVRESIAQPFEFNDVNVNGTLVLLEAARRHGLPRFVQASTSSVYGLSTLLPYREDDPLLSPLSPYGATKIACEKFGHIYHAVHGLPVVSLRFFTAYGPRQRPDMAVHRFARAVLCGEKIPLFGDGHSSRDYTYIGDIVQGVSSALYGAQSYDVVNLGNSVATELIELVRLIEAQCGAPAKLSYQAMQPGDPLSTCADLNHARKALGYEPRTPLQEGIKLFVEWLRGRL